MGAPGGRPAVVGPYDEQMARIANGQRPALGSRVLGRFRLLREVGEGSSARVFLVEDSAGGYAALKVLRSSRLERGGIKRFHREFRALARIAHPNVVRVYGFGRAEKVPYIVLEYVDGASLRRRLSALLRIDDRNRYKRIQEVLLDICHGLAAVHRCGLVHRDLKPSNILINRNGTAKLTDFGIVHRVDGGPSTAVGTWSYAAPEQFARYGHLDQRTDLYALGVITYELLTGSRPFTAPDRDGYAALHIGRVAPDPAQHASGIPPNLAAVCRRLLRKQPRQRYQSAEEVIRELCGRQAIGGQTSPSGLWYPPTVGRDSVMVELRQASAQLLAGRGGVLRIRGAAGLGKSRMVRDAGRLLRRRGVPTWAIGFRGSVSRSIGLYSFARDLCEELDAEAPAPLARVLTTSPSSSHVDHSRMTPRGRARYLLYDGVRQGLERVLGDGPQALLIDDIDHADPADRQMLVGLIRHLMDDQCLPLMVVVSAVDFGNGGLAALGDRVRTTTLGSLSREEVLAVLVDLLGESVVCRLLARRAYADSQGHPGTLIRGVRSLFARGLLSGKVGATTLRLGAHDVASLELRAGRGAVDDSVRRMNPMEVALLQRLALADGPLPVDAVVGALAEDDDVVLDAGERLLERGWITESATPREATWALADPRTSEAVLAEVDEVTLADSHRLLADSLLRFADNHPGVLESSAHHARLAGDYFDAYERLVTAAWRCRDVSLISEAWRLSQLADELEDELSQTVGDGDPLDDVRLALLELRADLLQTRGAWKEAAWACEALLSRAQRRQDGEQVRRWRVSLAAARRRAGETVKATDHAERALEDAEAAGDRRSAAAALHILSALAWNEGDAVRCVQYVRRGLGLVPSEHYPTEHAMLQRSMAAARVMEGALDDACVALRSAEQALVEVGDSRQRALVLAGLADVSLWQGDFGPGWESAKLAMFLAEEVDYALGRVVASRAAANAAWHLGCTSQAHALARSAADRAQRLGLASEAAASCATLQIIAAEQGRWSEVSVHGARGMRLVSKTNDREQWAPLLGARMLVGRLGMGLPPGMPLVAFRTGLAADLHPLRRIAVDLTLARGAMLGEQYNHAHLWANAALADSRLLGLVSAQLTAHSLLAQCPAEDATPHRHRLRAAEARISRTLSPGLREPFRARMHRLRQGTTPDNAAEDLD